MNKSEAKKRIDKLKKEVNHHRYLYHVLDAPELSDEATDALKKELADLEKQFPEFLTLDSPTQRVGGLAREEFTKVRHAKRQWSLNDSFTEEEVREFHERTIRFLKKEGVKNPRVVYTTELKIDGLHVVLTYKDGILITGATRGDGVTGEDVTQNLKTIEAIPLKLEEKINVIAEGEVLLSKKQFEKINKVREKAGETPYANPRNTAAGTIRQLDPEIVRKRNLDCFMYDLPEVKKKLATQEKELTYLEILGFKTTKKHKVCNTIDEVIAFWKSWEKKKDSLPYMIDGLVIKVNSREYQEILGHTGKAPRYALAIKFAPEQSTTVVEDISIQVGRTGALTPVAHLRPTFIAGSTVRRATLHNEDEIKRLDVRIGDTVILQKAGDIIPDVVEVIKNLRTGKEKRFVMPKSCPMCEGKVTRKRGEVALYCLNKDCFAKRLAGMTHFVAKGALNIDGLGGKLIEKLMNAGFIKIPADIFTLTREDLAPLEGLGEKSADNLISAISSAKQSELSKFIFGLGIRFIGSESAELVASLCPTVRNPKELLTCMKKITQTKIERVEGVGDKTGESVLEWFSKKVNQELLLAMHESGVRFRKVANSIEKSLIGKTYVLTGSLDGMTRDEAKTVLKARGAKVSTSVSKKTTGVIVGDDPGSKAINAKKLGVPVLSETDLKKLVRES